MGVTIIYQQFYKLQSILFVFKNEYGFHSITSKIPVFLVRKA